MAAEPAPTPSPHDILAAYLNEALNNGDIVPAREAERIADDFARRYPQEWAEYVGLESQRLIYAALRSALDSRRQRARKHAHAVAFGEAVASGEVSELGVFKLWRCRIDNDNTQRPIGDMTGADHRFVATDFEASAQESEMLAAFHRALAKRCGTKTTSEVMDEGTFTKLYESIVNP